MKPPPNSPLSAALERADATIQRMRARAFNAARMPYSKEDPMNEVATFPQTDLGTAAAVVVANLSLMRPTRWDGKKISAPGIYAGMPLESYHGDSASGPSVSSSSLRAIEGKSLIHYWAKSYLNPDREPFEPTPAMILGSAAHHLLLGELDFNKKFVLQLDEAPDGRAWSGNNNTCKRWLADMRAAGMTVLTKKQMESIKGMARSLAREPLVRDGLLNGLVEHSMFWKDTETGLWLKSRPDVIPLDGEAYCDLKVTQDASGDKCDWTMLDYGLHQQFGIVSEVAEHLFGERPGNDAFSFVFVESTEPFAVTVRPVDSDAISSGRMQNRRALRKLAKALEHYRKYSGDIAAAKEAGDDDEAERLTNIAIGEAFPSHDNNLTTVSLPFRAKKQIEEDIKGGLLDQRYA